MFVSNGSTWDALGSDSDNLTQDESSTANLRHSKMVLFNCLLIWELGMHLSYVFKLFTASTRAKNLLFLTKADIFM